jgi:hypothetical protein
MIHAEPVGHRLHRFPRPVGEQPTPVQLAVGPLLGPPQRRTQHLSGERLQPWPNPRHLLGTHPTITR